MADQHRGGAEFGERRKQRVARTCRRKYHAVNPMTRKNIDRLAQLAGGRRQEHGIAALGRSVAHGSQQRRVDRMKHDLRNFERENDADQTAAAAANCWACMLAE